MSYNCDDCDLDCAIVVKAPCRESFINDYKAFRAENERLRQALEKIASLENGKREKGIGYDDEIYQIAKLFLP